MALTGSGERCVTYSSVDLLHGTKHLAHTIVGSLAALMGRLQCFNDTGHEGTRILHHVDVHEDEAGLALN